MAVKKIQVIAFVMVIIAAVAIYVAVTAISSNRKELELHEEEEEEGEEGKEGEKEGEGGSHLQQFALRAIAVGKWGSLLSTQREINPKQAEVVKLLAESAKTFKPLFVMSHGNNLDLTGLHQKTIKERFEATYSKLYEHSSLTKIPWYAVMGPLDYGAGNFICGGSEPNGVPCKTEAELYAALEQRQKLEEHLEGNNFKYPGGMYKESFHDKEKDLSVEIFNLDANAAEQSGSHLICCQCNGYTAVQNSSKNTDCSAVARGEPFCFGGNVKLYDACMQKFESWASESLKDLQKQLKESDAMWKIVNTYHSIPDSMKAERRKEWLKALEDAKVQLALSGNIPAEKHDFGSGNCHFITNGGGGGEISVPAQKSSQRNIWLSTGEVYGFYELSFSKNILQARFKSSDNKSSKDSCWEIPRNGSLGSACAS